MPTIHPQALAGIGLKTAHAQTALAAGSTADFFELHAENAMVAGGPARRLIERLRERFPLSVHGVGLSLGGMQRPEAAHLARLAEVVRRLQPAWVSEHLAWSSHQGRYLADLLPLAYDEATLQRVVGHVDELQTRLGRRVLIENPSAYLRHEGSSRAEAQFLGDLVSRSGCGLLLDVTNAWISANNLEGDAQAFIEALPAQAIGEIHLAGFACEDEPSTSNHGVAGELYIDSHGAAVPEAVWSLYTAAIDSIGPRATLIERDHEVPPLAVLEQEAERARGLMREAAAPSARWRQGRTPPPMHEVPEVRVVAPSCVVADAGKARENLSKVLEARSVLDPHDAFVAALRDPQQAVPIGLAAPAGRSPTRRFDVHRNNHLGALVAVLADTFPVLHAMLGKDCFEATAVAYARHEAPSTPVLLDYGAGLPDWLQAFEPLAAWPHLADVARLEWLRHRAAHAADARGLDDAAWAACLARGFDPATLRCHLHPSLGVLRSPHAVVSIWEAHQQADVEASLAQVDRTRAESALVLRAADDAVWVVPVTARAAVFVEALQRGAAWQDAWVLAHADAQAEAGREADAPLDLAPLVAVLLRHRAVIALADATPPCDVAAAPSPTHVCEPLLESMP